MSSLQNFIQATSLCCLLLLTACSSGYQVVFPLSQSSSSSSVASTSTAHSSSKSVSSVPHSSASVASSSSALPASVLIKVPFQTQAPLNNWDAVHEQACEEAALILDNFYLNGKTITPEVMQERIASLISYESQHGYKQDVTVEELKKIAEDFYGLHGTVLTDVSIQSLKEQLADGHPIIIPAAGRMLKNPYYSGDGPWYHMMVVIGYDDTSFITNDVGTKRGAQYHYTYNVLINAIHDWTGTDDMIASGPKRVLVLTK